MYIVICAGTYSHVVEDKMCRKIVPDILFTGRIPEWTEGATLRKMVAYEILRMKFAHSFNRFVWVCNPPASVAEYTSQKMTRLGQLCSKIVGQIVQSDPADELTKPILERLNKTVVHMMHWWADSRQKMESFDLSKIEEDVGGSRTYQVKCFQAPFWKPKKLQLDVYSSFIMVASPDGEDDGPVDTPGWRRWD
jgi:hypothetical protein